MPKGFDKPILLIFFNRPDMFEKVFEEVRKIAPRKLYLAQDGPRVGRADEENIERCREIASNIDWECDVIKNYSDINLGCGMRPQTAISWAFETEEELIILEDDCVPEPSFFSYCSELLDKYNKDERISYISGLNHFENWDFGNASYGFAKGGAIGAWATWKRAWSLYDYEVKKINDDYFKKLLLKNEEPVKSRVKLWKETNERLSNGENLSYWDVQWGFVKYTQNQLVVVPRYNLIRNIGVGVGSTHGKGISLSHKKYSDYNNMPTFPLEFPLKHPEHMMCDNEYDRLLVKCNKKIKRHVIYKAIIKKIFKKK